MNRTAYLHILACIANASRPHTDAEQYAAAEALGELRRLPEPQMALPLSTDPA